MLGLTGIFHEMFLGIGFSNRCTIWLMQCVTTASFRLIVNGRTWYSFQPERGIREGDPLSLYISIICVESLGCYIHFLNN